MAARPYDAEVLKQARPLSEVVRESGVELDSRWSGRGTHKALCPFHAEKTPSLLVDDRDGHFHCFGCLPPGSLIKTEHGMRPIETVQVGDRVYAGDGKLHEVLLTHERPYEGELMKIVATPFKVPVYLTPNHMVPVRRPRSGKIEEVPAAELRPQNRIAYPLIERQATPLSWLPVPGSRRKYGRAPKDLPEVTDTEIFADWLGWYLAEGSTSNGRTVKFSLGGDEGGVAERLRRHTQALFGCELKVRRTTPTQIEAWFGHALLSRWLEEHCGQGARRKRVPDFVWTWPSTCQRILLEALVAGDGGGRRPDSAIGGRTLRSCAWSLRSASPTLIDGARDLLIANGAAPTSVYEERYEDGRVVWGLHTSPDAPDRWGQQPASEVLSRIRKVERVPYSGRVYNLTVAEQHTYITFTGTVNNCGSHGDVFDFLQKLHNLTFPQACERLGGTWGDLPVPPVQRRGAPPPRRWDQLTLLEQEVMNRAADLYHGSLRSARHVHAYLRERGVDPDLVRECTLGYSDGKGLPPALAAAGPKYVEAALALGLLRDRGEGPREFLAGRLVVPEIRGGNCIWMIGRSVSARPRTPKYLALDGEKPVLGWERAAGKSEVVLTEGPFDYLAALAAGYAAASLCGTSIAPERLGFLARAERVCIVLDGDDAGREGAEKLRDVLGDRCVRVALPEGSDLGDMARLPAGRARVRELIGAALARDTASIHAGGEADGDPGAH